MAVNTITIGLASIEIGAIANDGGMGQTLEVWGFTEQDSCKFTRDQPTITDFIPEEIDDPIYSQEQPASVMLAFTIMDPGTDTLASVTGGEVITTGTSPNEVMTFHAPNSIVNIERSIKVTSKEGLVLEITRGKMTYSLDSTFGKSGLFTVKVQAKVLAPTKANESAWRMYKQ